MKETRSLARSFNYAIEGVIHVLRSQRNLRIHMMVAAVVLAASVILRVPRVEFLILLFAIALVIVAEMTNSAIESAIDIFTTTHDPLAKAAKDVAAGGVLVASMAAVIIGFFVFFPRLNPITLMAMEQVRSLPPNVTFAALLLTVIAVISLKAMAHERSFLRGGWPSGHAALAACLFTAIAYVSKEPFVATLGLLMGLLVMQSRIEAGIHSVMQIVVGATVGVIITTLIFQVLWFSRLFG